MVGLVESYANDQGLGLSANEVMQIVRATADDIDFSTPNAVDPANNFGTPTGNPLIDTVRYPTRPGWDEIDGYGRANAYEMLKAVGDGRIPPEAMIDGPSWFDLLGVSGNVPVTGRVAAPRADSFDYRVEWAPGVQPPAYPDTDTWTVIASDTGLTSPVSGTLANLDLASVATALPDGGSGPPVDPSSSPHMAEAVMGSPARCRNRSSCTTTRTCCRSHRRASRAPVRPHRCSSISTAMDTTRCCSPPTTAMYTRTSPI
jgi:hypothetical protein